jgi:hypothetical protein
MKIKKVEQTDDFNAIFRIYALSCVFWRQEGRQATLSLILGTVNK